MKSNLQWPEDPNAPNWVSSQNKRARTAMEHKYTPQNFSPAADPFLKTMDAKGKVLDARERNLSKEPGWLSANPGERNVWQNEAGWSPGATVSQNGMQRQSSKGVKPIVSEREVKGQLFGPPVPWFTQEGGDGKAGSDSGQDSFSTFMQKISYYLQDDDDEVL